MRNGFGGGIGIGRGLGGGKGFDSRGSSPPWPYVGMGRGGLPRCGYVVGGARAIPSGPYRNPSYVPAAVPMTPDEELSALKNEAEAIKGQLGDIETRMRDLESQ